MGRGGAERILYGAGLSLQRPKEPALESHWSRASHVELRLLVNVRNSILLMAYATKHYERKHKLAPGGGKPLSTDEALLQALIFCSENPDPASYGVKVNDAVAGSKRDASFPITVRLSILDPDLLSEFARERYADCWGDSNWAPANLADAALEAMVNSNMNPSPDSYGIEIVSTEAVLIDPNH